MILRNSENNNFDSTSLLHFIHKWRKPIIIVIVLAIAASVIFSSPYFIKPKYKSTVILYPTATSAISKALLSENTSPKDDILKFGEDEETEQMLQILHSNKIRDRIIDKFNLMVHYNINPDSKYKNTKLFREYENNISFRRTEFMAVKITVLDTDAQMAADIANNIAELLDSTKNEMQKERSFKAYTIVREQYLKLKNEIREMEDSLTVLREFGVNDYESQSEMINRQLAIELAKGNREGVKRLEAKLNILAKYGGPYVSIRDALEYEKKQLSMIKAKYEEAKTDAEEYLPQKFVVNSAYKAERKSFPIRWLIVVITTISAILLTIILILIFENINPYVKEYTRIYNSNSVKKTRVSIETSNHPGSLPRIEETLNDSRKEIQKANHGNNPTEEKNYNEDINTNKTEKPENKPLPLAEKSENDINKYFVNMNIIKLLFKWKLHLGVIVLISVILAVIFSGPTFITPEFKSFAIVYPSNVNPYSEESETEQMLQFLQSKDIMDVIIEKFDIAERYEISSDNKHFYSAISRLYSENVKVTKTPYESVKIEVFDTNPQVACDMVDAIINLYNVKVKKEHRKKYLETVEFMKMRLDNKQYEIDSVANELYTLRTEYGIIDYPNQSREVARGFLRTVDGDNAANINTREVLKLKKNIEEMGGEWVKYNDRYYDLIAEYGKYKIDYDWAIANADKTISYATIISKPFPADKKSSPVRWVIVAITAVATLFLAFIVILFMENYKTIFRKD